MIFFLKFAELDFSEIIKLSVQLKNGAYFTEILQISIYPYSPEKVQFSSLIFWVNLIFPTRKLPHKANFTKIIYLSVQINLDKKVQPQVAVRKKTKNLHKKAGNGTVQALACDSLKFSCDLRSRFEKNKKFAQKSR